VKRPGQQRLRGRRHESRHRPGEPGCSGGRLPRSCARGHEVRILNRRSPQHRIDRTTGEGLDVVLACCDVALRREQRHVDAPRRRSSRAPGGCSPRRRPRA
jgi:hypothetical protein